MFAQSVSAGNSEKNTYSRDWLVKLKSSLKGAHSYAKNSKKYFINYQVQSIKKDIEMFCFFHLINLGRLEQKKMLVILEVLEHM